MVMTMSTDAKMMCAACDALLLSEYYRRLGFCDECNYEDRSGDLEDRLDRALSDDDES